MFRNAGAIPREVERSARRGRSKPYFFFADCKAPLPRATIAAIILCDSGSEDFFGNRCKAAGVRVGVLQERAWADQGTSQLMKDGGPSSVSSCLKLLMQGSSGLIRESHIVQAQAHARLPSAHHRSGTTAAWLRSQGSGR